MKHRLRSGAPIRIDRSERTLRALWARALLAGIATGPACAPSSFDSNAAPPPSAECLEGVLDGAVCRMVRSDAEVALPGDAQVALDAAPQPSDAQSNAAPRLDGGREDDADAPDADAPDAATMMPAPCLATAPFTHTEALGELNSDGAESTPRLSADQRSIYFSYRSPAGALSIRSASRPSGGASFGPLVALALPSGSSGPSVGDDGSLFYSFDSGTSGPDLYVATPPYVAPRRALTELNSPHWDYLPFLAADGKPLYFTRRAQDGDDEQTEQDDVFVADLAGGHFEQPRALATVNTAAWSERSPVLSADGLQLYFASDRPGGSGDFDIYVATRSGTDQLFGAVSGLATLNTSAEEAPGWLSADGCTLYFSSTRSGGLGASDLWVASRR